MDLREFVLNASDYASYADIGSLPWRLFRRARGGGRSGRADEAAPGCLDRHLRPRRQPELVHDVLDVNFGERCARLEFAIALRSGSLATENPLWQSALAEIHEANAESTTSRSVPAGQRFVPQPRPERFLRGRCQWWTGGGRLLGQQKSSRTPTV